MPDITKEDLFLFVGKKERRYRDLIWYGNCDPREEKRDPTRPFISKNTLLHYKKELWNEGRLRKRLDIEGNKVYYVPPKFYPELEAIEQRKQFRSELDNLTPEEQIETIKKLTRDLKRLKLEKRIMDLERLPLPISVLEKMFGKKNARTFENWYEYTKKTELPSELREIEVKTVPQQEFERKYRKGWLLLKNDAKIVWNEKNEFREIKYEKKMVIIGIYEELLRLYEKQFNENLEMWKRTYDLDFVMWDEVGMIIHEMIGTGYTISEIQEALVDRIVEDEEK
jgi:hypothetical protein